MRLAIFGSPVAHSLSPAMHRAALAHIGRRGDYVARDVDAAGLLLGIAELRTGALDGANVTMPHKMAAFEACDEHSEQASRVGAINTLYMAHGRLVGDNTDVVGIELAWAARGLPQDEPVIILGAGGASAAAQVALADRDQYIVARRPQVAQEVVGRIGVGGVVVPWGEPVPRGVVVNATSLGMHDELLPSYLLEGAAGLLDMAYGDAPTRSVAALQGQGIPVAEGLDMLVGQAVGSFAIWTGVEVEADVFRAAALEELEKRAAQRPGGKNGVR